MVFWSSYCALHPVSNVNDMAFVIREPLLDEPAVADGPWLEFDSTDRILHIIVLLFVIFLMLPSTIPHLC